MAPINFLTQGRAAKQFSGMFNPDNQQDNTLRPGNNTLDQPTPMMDLYKKSLEEMPDEKNYSHPLLQKILAGIAGFSTMNPTTAYKTSKSIQDEPYESDLGRWKNKIGQTGELAGLEEKTNANKIKNFLDFQDQQRKNKDTDSSINYRGIEGRNLEDEMSLRGRTHGINKLTGEDIEFDRYGHPVYKIKMDETPDEKDARHLNTYKADKKVDLLNEQSLIGTRATAEQGTHRANLITDNEIKLPAELANSEALETFKNDLAKVSPTQRNAALAGAVEKSILDNPNWQKFTDPTTGNLKLDAADPDYDEFRSSISKYLNTPEAGAQVKPKKPVGNPLSPRGTSPKNSDPDQESKNALKGQKDGYYELSDGSAWNIKNGVISAATKATK